MPLIAGALLKCATIITQLVGYVDPLHTERTLVCAEVLSKAVEQAVDPALALAVAWRESNFTRPPPNPWNCAGPMQVKVHYWCPNRAGAWSLHDADGVLHGCDLVDAGVRGLRYYVTRASGDEYAALCRYGWGRCDTRERRDYTRRTLALRDLFARRLLLLAD